jgi:hypothetical protein
MKQNYVNNDVKDFIKNHQQVEQEKKIERQRAESCQRSGRAAVDAQPIGSNG